MKRIETKFESNGESGINKTTDFEKKFSLGAANGEKSIQKKLKRMKNEIENVMRNEGKNIGKSILNKNENAGIVTILLIKIRSERELTNIEKRLMVV